MKEKLEALLLSLTQAYEDAQEGVHIPADEHYESDEWYEGAIYAVKTMLESLS